MSPCLKEDTLLELYGGGGTAVELEHLRACGSCGAAYAALARDLAIVRRALDELPAAARAQARPARRWLPAGLALAALALLAFAWRNWQPVAPHPDAPADRANAVAFAGEVSRAIFAGGEKRGEDADDLAHLQAALNGSWPCTGNPLYDPSCDVDDLEDEILDGD